MALNDLDWIDNTMMVPNQNANTENGQMFSYYHTRFKFTDTTIGGNIHINPPPQFTPTADLRSVGLSRFGRLSGLGRKYSSMIDDNSQVIHIRAGVPEWNSLTTFFTGFYQHPAAILARTGRSTSLFFNIGRAAGWVVTIPLLPLIMVGNLYRFIFNKPASKFYYFKPDMHNYWVAANTILNGIAVNEGLVRFPSPGGADGNDDYSDEDDAVYRTDQIMTGAMMDNNNYSALFPELYTAGSIDLFSVANKAKRMQASLMEANNYYYQTSAFADTSIMNQSTIEPYNLSGMDNFTGGSGGLHAALARYQASEAGGMLDLDDGIESDSIEDNKDNWLDSSFIDYLEAEMRHGAAFASFRVNHTGTATETFNNSTAPSEIQQRFNSTSASAASKRFNFAEGNIGGGIVGNAVQGALGAVGDIAKGFLAQVQLDGLVALGGNAFVDIPDRWQDSKASMQSLSYKIELRAPYAHPFSRLQNIWIPLSMLLAASLPKSTGKASYTWPPLIEIYDKGKGQSRMAMVDSITITRGVGNVGWTRDKRPLGIDVDITFKDLSSVMYMPINASPGFFDEASMYTDYLATLGSLGLEDQAYADNRLLINANRTIAHYSQYINSGYWASKIGNTKTARGLANIRRIGDTYF